MKSSIVDKVAIFKNRNTEYCKLISQLFFYRKAAI